MDTNSNLASVLCTVEQNLLYPAITAVTGITVAIAYLLPETVRTALLVAVSLAWLVASMLIVGGWTLQLISRALSNKRSSQPLFDRFMGAFGSLAILTVIVAGAQLWIARHFLADESLFWNVDWRYALSHAQAIVVHGDLRSTLDYAGAPIDYHVGPAWIAGALGRALAIPAAESMFALIPLASTISIVYAMTSIGRGLGLNHNIGIAAVGVACLFPAADLTLQQIYWNPAVILSVESAPFGVGTMINAYFAMAVGFSALAILLRQQVSTLPRVLGALGLGSLVAIKPQYFLGLGLLFGIRTVVPFATTLFKQARERISRQGFSKTRAILSLILAVTAVVFPKLLFGQHPALTVLVGSIFFAVILIVSWNKHLLTDEPNSRLLLACGSGALVFAFVLIPLIPGAPSFFGQPQWEPGTEGWTKQIYFSLSALLFLIATAFFASVEKQDTTSKVFSLAWFTFAAIAILTIALRTVVFPVSPELLVRGSLLGGYDVGELRQHNNLAQSLIPLKILLVFGCTAVILTHARSGRTILKVAASIGIILVLLIGAGTLLPGFKDPATGYEATQDRNMRKTLELIPVRGSKIVSSDIADSAENYERAANATGFPAYFGHSFYVSDFRYMNWVRADAPDRLQYLQKFFGANWSEWHSNWVTKNEITHVIIHKRCEPVWAKEAGQFMDYIGGSGAWSAYETRPQNSITVVRSLNDPIEPHPAFGNAYCLSLKRTSSD